MMAGNGQTKEAKAASAKKYREANKEKIREAKKWTHIWNTYRLTQDDFNALWMMQGKVCQVCKQDTEHKFVDHCHATGDVRGILCPSCNTFVGHIEKEQGRIDAALDYIGGRP